MNAFKWGETHGSCWLALEWRRSLGPYATQADAYRLCHRGDWLIWQLLRLPAQTVEGLHPAIDRALERIVTRAIRHRLRALRGLRGQPVRTWRRWARRWLSGEDRTPPTYEVVRSDQPGWRVAKIAEKLLEMNRDSDRSEPRILAVLEQATTAEWEGTRWLSGTAHTAWLAHVAEALQQARDLRREIPVWPG